MKILEKIRTNDWLVCLAVVLWLVILLTGCDENSTVTRASGTCIVTTNGVVYQYEYNHWDKWSVLSNAAQ